MSQKVFLVDVNMSGNIVKNPAFDAGAIAIAALSTNPLARANHTGTQTASTVSDFDTQVRTSRLDQMAAPTGSVAMNSQKFTGVASASSTGQYVEYTQWQNALNGTDWKTAVRVRTTANITLSGAQTIDGVSIVSGDRVLVANQTTGSQNGIYAAAVGSWARAVDQPASSSAAADAVFVNEGTTYGNTQWTCGNDSGSDIVGTDALTFTQIGASTSYTADESTLHLTGSAFSIKSTYVGQSSITTLGTIATGVWQGTAVANGYIASSLSGKTYEGMTITTSSGVFTLANSKTLTVSNTLTLTGTDTASIAFGSGGTVAYTSSKLSAFAATTSSELAGVISDETGTGALMFATSPAITTGVGVGGAATTGNSAKFYGTVSGSVTLSALATAGSGVLTLPGSTGALVSTGDTGTVTNAMLGGSIGASKLVGTDITTVGTIGTGTWQGTAVAVAYGGTGAATAAGARTNLSAAGTYTTTVGDGSAVAITVTHNLGTRNVVVSVYTNGGVYDEVECAVEKTTTNTITLRFNTAPTSNQYAVVVIG